MEATNDTPDNTHPHTEPEQTPVIKEKGIIIIIDKKDGKEKEISTWEKEEGGQASLSLGSSIVNHTGIEDIIQPRDSDIYRGGGGGGGGGLWEKMISSCWWWWPTK
jgi:hypothetical protein